MSEAVSIARSRGRLGPWLELSKARLTSMVLVTTAVGYVLGSGGGAVGWAGLVWTLVGTALAAAGAAAFNQVWEVERDGRMERTRGRPLPTGEISRAGGLGFAVGASAAGVGVLAWQVNGLTAALGLANVLIYVLLYTPLKVRTSLNTLVGGDLRGLAADDGLGGGDGGLGLGAWLLGAILFIWQIPHFLALAWLYREDYVRGGFRMLPVLDPEGRLTCLLIVLYSLALLPLGLAVSALGIAGWVYGVGSVVLGLGLVGLGLGLARSKSRGQARRVFLATVSYLPLLLGLMVADRTGW